MVVRKSMIMCIFAAASVLACSARGQATEASQRVDSNLEDLLFAAARHYDCYFSLEIAAGPDASLRLDRPMKTVAGETTFANFLQQLSNELPGIAVERDPRNQVVVHLRDRALVGGSVLDQRVKLTYEGPIQGLPSAIAENAKVSLKAQRVFALPGPVHMDSSTCVRFSQREVRARDFMTQCMPLSGYSRILWSAYSLTKEPKSTTVALWGPMSFVDKLPGKGAVAFRDGEAAYRALPDGVEEEKDAIEFIRNELGAAQPQQVRWAMFWLGRWKVRSGVAVLVDNIDYKYTNSWLFEENYPAVHALGMMGQSVVPQLVQAVRAERNQSRLNLLIYALALTRMGQHGRPDTDKLRVDLESVEAEKQKAAWVVAEAIAGGSDPFAYFDSNQTATTTPK
jgi:hypothetical protein